MALCEVTTRRLPRPRRWPLAAALLATLTMAGAAAGDEARGSQLDLGSLVRPGLYLPVGLSMAGSFREAAPDGLVLGGEASLVNIGQSGPPGAWFGGYVDGAWDFGVNAFRHSTGPEFGIAMLGLDLGYLGEARTEGYRAGFGARGFLTVGVLSVYGRYGRLYGQEAADDEDVAELGVLAKVPLLLWEQRESAEEHAGSSGRLANPLQSWLDDPW